MADQPKRNNEKKAAKLDARDPDAALGPPNPEPQEIAVKDIPTDLSPADLELSLTAAVGEEIIVKSNAETPSAQQVAAATSIATGPAITTVSVKDSDGNEHSEALTPDNAALLSQRAVATGREHPANALLGWSNPNLKDKTDEEREEDQKDWEKRAKATA